jgi:hypothetical protein
MSLRTFGEFKRALGLADNGDIDDWFWRTGFELDVHIEEEPEPDDFEGAVVFRIRETGTAVEFPTTLGRLWLQVSELEDQVLAEIEAESAAEVPEELTNRIRPKPKRSIKEAGVQVDDMETDEPAAQSGKRYLRRIACPVRGCAWTGSHFAEHMRNNHYQITLQILWAWGDLAHQGGTGQALARAMTWDTDERSELIPTAPEPD